MIQLKRDFNIQNIDKQEVNEAIQGQIRKKFKDKEGFIAHAGVDLQFILKLGFTNG